MWFVGLGFFVLKGGGGDFDGGLGFLFEFFLFVRGIFFPLSEQLLEVVIALKPSELEIFNSLFSLVF